MSSPKAVQVLSSAKSLRRNARSTPSTLAKEEQRKIELDSLRSQVIRSELQNDELRDIIQLRKDYSKKSYFSQEFGLQLHLFLLYLMDGAYGTAILVLKFSSLL